MLLERAIRRMEEHRAKVLSLQQNTPGQNILRVAAPPAPPAPPSLEREELQMFRFHEELIHQPSEEKSNFQMYHEELLNKK